MQSGYGVPKIQQFMVDGSFSSLLQHQQQQQQQQQRFHHLQSIPITQQFFQQQQQQQHQFQVFQQQQQQRRLHQQLGLDIDSGPENSNSPSRFIASNGGGGFSFIAANFKLAAAANENSSRQETLNDDDPIGREDASDSRTTVAVHPWQQQREEDSSIKEPFWKPLDVEYINKNNKRCKEKMENSNKFSKKSDKCNENEEGKNSDSNYVLFGELEAIYAQGGGGGVNNQTGSGSALTGDNNPPAAAVLPGPPSGPISGIDHGSETFNGEEASLKKLQKSRKKKKRKHLGSVATFFKSLVKKVMDHQESLHRKFLEVMEKRDQERTKREETWRQEQTTKLSCEAIARTQERAISASREAAIVSFLEKITGESINLLNTHQFQCNSQFQEESFKEENIIEQPKTIHDKNSSENNMNMTNTRRWPKTEVQALIRVRSSLESKFQEPGLKGPLWEEVSSSMASLGYQRNAKRCKEKWENINKYFRKTKDSAKKRSQHSKTCPYFHQLHQLYSKSSNLPTTVKQQQQIDSSELLDAIIVAPQTDQENAQNLSLEFNAKEIDGMCRSYKFSEMVSMRLENESDNNANEGSSARAGKQLFGNEEEYEEGEGDDGDDSVEGEGENQEHVKNQGIGRENGGEEEHHQKHMFFLP
ncbi:trihelix transcription factor DF1-like [Magnolia sinica]|uniref:trihelix transcription factor DF1-like n=1 Tax=Magnolia sinica TaxID=86752 RepID=UPI00265B6AAC|nr:trihelix transcription factor DF1-like [Magnolia sinica]